RLPYGSRVAIGDLRQLVRRPEHVSIPRLAGQPAPVQHGEHRPRAQEVRHLSGDWGPAVRARQEARDPAIPKQIEQPEPVVQERRCVATYELTSWAEGARGPQTCAPGPDGQGQAIALMGRRVVAGGARDVAI